MKIQVLPSGVEIYSNDGIPVTKKVSDTKWFEGVFAGYYLFIVCPTKIQKKENSTITVVRKK